MSIAILKDSMKEHLAINTQALKPGEVDNEDYNDDYRNFYGNRSGANL